MTPVSVTVQERPATRRRSGGPAPYGWRWAGGSLIPVTGEQHVRWLILHLSGEGWSLAKIQAHLAAVHIYNREGQSWSRAALHRLVSANVTATG